MPVLIDLTNVPLDHLDRSIDRLFQANLSFLCAKIKSIHATSIYVGARPSELTD